MRKPLLVLLLLLLVITVKAQQNNKPADALPGQSQNTNQETKPEPTGGIDVFTRYMKKYTNHQYKIFRTAHVAKTSR